MQDARPALHQAGASPSEARLGLVLIHGRGASAADILGLGAALDLDDIAFAAVYLASDEAKFVTGQCLSPNGGWYMSQ